MTDPPHRYPGKRPWAGGGAFRFLRPPDDELTARQQFLDRTTAVNGLRFRDVFATASLRLLVDLVDALRGTHQSKALTETEGKAIAVEYAARASPTLFASLQLADRDRGLGADASPHTQIVFVARRTGWPGAPLEALTRHLGAALASAFSEDAGILVFDRRDGEPVARLSVWHALQGRFEEWAGPPLDFSSDQAVLDALAPRRLAHLFLVEPEHLDDLPPGFRLQCFCHRVVYVTDVVPDRVPAPLARLLRPDVRLACGRVPSDWTSQPLVQLLDPTGPPSASTDDPEGPYFCSFITALAQGPRSAPLPFDSEPVDDEVHIPRAARALRPGWRIDRDLCRIDFDAESVERLARAVTNRQIGVAASGGGAESYRLVAALRLLAADGIPVDVVGGVSGGALVGAYYCARGMPGLERCVESGPQLQIALGVGTLWSEVFRMVVDQDLETARVEALPVRFVAVAAGLCDGKRPQAHAIVAGTVGEAVQASGSAPLGFAPTDKVLPNGQGTIRYVDGALATMIPARILKDFGADYVLAFNCVSGPARRNPLDAFALGRFLYDHTPFSRLVDLWVGGAYLIQITSREVCEDAHVYYEPLEEDRPLIGSLRFADAHEIVRDAEASPDLRRHIAECVQLWAAVSRPRAPGS